MTNAQHTTASVEWYTPVDVVEAIREALGGTIEIDPASSTAAQARVRATVHFTLARPLDPAALEGARTLFMNPPSPPRDWWQIASYWAQLPGDRRGVYLAFSLEQLQQSHRWTPEAPMGSHRVLIPAKRIPYDTTAACRIATLEKKGIGPTHAKEYARLVKLDPETIIKGEQPTHAAALVLLGDVDPKPLLACLGGTLTVPS